MTPPPTNPGQVTLRRLSVGMALLVLMVINGGQVIAQSLDERLDEDRFLRGLSEYRLPEVLQHYFRKHPPRDAVEAALIGITTTRMPLGDPTLSPAQRLTVVEQVLAARQVVIDEHPFDNRHATWLAEQASDLFFVLYPIEATGLTTEFGLASPDQLNRARYVAATIKTLMSDAELEISEAILNIESEPGYEDDIALQLKRRRLARDERDRRIPFLHGVGSYLHGLHNLDDPLEQREQFQITVDLLLPLLRDLDGTLQTRARLYCALAMSRVGRGREARALLDQVIAASDSEPGDIFAARMGAIMARMTQGETGDTEKELDALAEGYVKPSDLFYRMLIADRRFILRRDVALAGPVEDRDQGLQRAFSTYTDLLDADMGVSKQTIRSIVFFKLSSAASGDVPLSLLPAIVTVARAENLARDQGTRSEAIDLFTQSLLRDDLDEMTRAAILFGLARAEHEDRNWLAAADRFTQLAREHPRNSQAEQAIEIAVALLADVYRKTVDQMEVEQKYDASLQLMLEKYPNLKDIDRWRYQAALLRFDQARFSEARTLLGSIPPGADVWLDGRFLFARVAHEEATTSDDPGARRTAFQSLQSSIEQVRRDLDNGILGAATRERGATLAYYRSFLDVFEAEGLIELGREDEAIERLDGWSSESGLDQAVLGRVLSLRIRAYQRAGRGEEARGEVQEFLDTIPEQAGQVIGAMLGSLRSEVEALLLRGKEAEATNKAQADLVPLADALLEWVDSAALGVDEQTPLLLGIADAYRLAKQFPQARKLYERVLLDRPTALQANFGRAECLFGEEQWAEAMGLYKQIAGSRRGSQDRYFWSSELKSLQILDRLDRNTRQIVPRIQGLRQIDAILGGDQFRRQFNSLEAKHSSGR